MEDPRKLTKAQYEKMEKALEESIQEAGPVEFHRFSNGLGEIWAAMKPDGTDGGYAVGFALCNPMDKSMPRRYRRWKGRHLSLSRLMTARRPVNIVMKPPFDEDENTRKRLREVITEHLFNEMQSSSDPFPPGMFGVREYRGRDERGAFRTWIRKFTEKLYNDIRVAKYRAEDAAKAGQPA